MGRSTEVEIDSEKKENPHSLTAVVFHDGGRGIVDAIARACEDSGVEVIGKYPNLYFLLDKLLEYLRDANEFSPDIFILHRDTRLSPLELPDFTQKVSRIIGEEVEARDIAPNYWQIPAGVREDYYDPNMTIISLTIKAIKKAYEGSGKIPIIVIVSGVVEEVGKVAKEVGTSGSDKSLPADFLVDTEGLAKQGIPKRILSVAMGNEDRPHKMELVWC